MSAISTVKGKVRGRSTTITPITIMRITTTTMPTRNQRPQLLHWKGLSTPARCIPRSGSHSPAIAPVSGPASSPIDAATAATLEQLRQLLAALPGGGAGPDASTPAPEPLRQLPVSQPGSNGNVVQMVPVQDVLLLQAADKYVRVVTAQGEHLVRTALKELLPQLDAAQFWQIHRSAAVRADAIETVRRDDAGRLHLTLRGTPETLAVSRLYAGRFKGL